jgi:hypothetical protein
VLSATARKPAAATHWSTRRLPPTWPCLAAWRTHEYTRHGTTSLFAALEVASGKVHVRSLRRDRHAEFIAFLNSLVRRYSGRELHPICDNCGTHKHPAVMRWRESIRAFICTSPRPGPLGSTWLSAGSG